MGRKILDFILGVFIVPLIVVLLIIRIGNGRPFGIEYIPNEDGASYTLSDYGWCNKDKVFIVPSSYNGKPVTKIGEKAFAFCKFESIVLPDSITSIESNAFSSCNIKNLTIGNGVTSIGDQALYTQYGLKHVTIPKSVTIIGKEAFRCGNVLTCYYYAGTEDDWANIEIKAGNQFNGTIYYYSETMPTEDGNYWHYDANGEIAVWP